MANEFIARNGLISQNNSVVTGSLIVTQGITGSLQGTATTASYVQNAVTASYVLQAVSASFSTTSSFAQNVQGGTVNKGLVQAFSLGLQNIF